MKLYRLQKEGYDPTKKIVIQRLREYWNDGYPEGIRDKGEGRFALVESDSRGFESWSGDMVVPKGGRLEGNCPENPFVYCLFTEYSDLIKIKETFPRNKYIYRVQISNLMNTITHELKEFCLINNTKLTMIKADMVIYTTSFMPADPKVTGVLNSRTYPLEPIFDNIPDADVFFTKSHQYSYQSEYRIAFDFLDTDITEVVIESSALEHCFNYLREIDRSKS